MNEISAIALTTAFAAGTASFLSPCVLPLVPGYLSYVAGHSVAQSRSANPAQRFTAFSLSLCFVLGFSTVFTILGASATALGQALLRYRYEANILGGIVVIVFGLFTTGLVRIPWLEWDVRFHGKVSGVGPLGAYLLGLAFGFGWTPCIGPILGAILIISATKTTVATGVALLSAYSVGLGIPFLAAAVFTGAFLKRARALGRVGRPLQITAGIIMIIMGLAMVTGQLTVFAWWLLNTVPAFSRIG